MKPKGFISVLLVVLLCFGALLPAAFADQNVTASTGAEQTATADASGQQNATGQQQQSDSPELPPVQSSDDAVGSDLATTPADQIDQPAQPSQSFSDTEEDGAGNPADQSVAEATDDQATTELQDPATEINTLANNTGEALAPGTYIIRSAISDTRVLDIAAGSKADKANLQLYTSNMTQAQQFEVAVVSNGYYTFKNVRSGKVLDVARSGKTDGTNVWQYSWNNTAAQKWSLHKNSNGSYTIESAVASNLRLDVSASRNADGTNIQVWHNNNTKAQSFYFIPTNLVSVTSSNVALSTGIYTISNSLSPTRVIDVPSSSTTAGTQLHIYNSNGTDAQKYYIQAQADGLFSIRPMTSGLALASKGENLVATTAVVQQAYNPNSKSQLWSIQNSGNGSVNFVNAASGHYLDIIGANPDARTKLHLYYGNGTNAQKFKLTAISTSATITPGILAITPNSQPNNRLDLAQSSQDAGANIQSHASNNTAAQKFQTTINPDGSYAFSVLASGQFLTDVNSNVVQMPKTTDGSQYWKSSFNAGGIVLQNVATGRYMNLVGNDIRTIDVANRVSLFEVPATAGLSFTKVPAVSDGYYVISSAVGNKVLDIANGSLDSGANVRIWTPNGTASQIWKVVQGPDGSTMIYNARSDKSLDVATANANSGTNVQQYDPNGTNAQKWTIKPSGDGWFTVTSFVGDNNLGVDGGINADGTNVAVYTPTNDSSQKFRFSPTNYKRELLDGIDVSSWQPSDIGWRVDYDFMIVKSSGGNVYTNPNFKAQADSVLSRGKMLGLYHFANDFNNDASAVAEAAYFVNAAKPYLGKAALFLDYEEDLPGNDRDWIIKFVNEVKRLTGYPCHIYTSGSWANNYIPGLWTELGVKLWQANYWNSTQPFQGYRQNITPMVPCTIYQYTSQGRLSGYTSNLDLNVFYGNVDNWRELYKKTA